MNNKQLIPRLTPEMFKQYPSQTADILNRVIDAINELNNK